MRFLPNALPMFQPKCIRSMLLSAESTDTGDTSRGVSPTVIYPLGRANISSFAPRHSLQAFSALGLSSVPAHVEMMGFLGMGNNPMVGATVAIAVAIQQAMN